MRLASDIVYRFRALGCQVASTDVIDLCIRADTLGVYLAGAGLFAGSSWRQPVLHHAVESTKASDDVPINTAFTV
jgi:hypothetical protein